MDSLSFCMATRFLQFGEPDVITFLLGWCALSLVGTLIAVSLIRAGKRRQPEADNIANNEVVPVTVPVTYDR
ncbi:hypothetical protein [Pseudomonas bohemica]|jgi:hypothetical protein|uniref:hypothetical protein n=1 Tax=Pseudomonas bohemica TaxID=2044872 RepID=UPI000DA61696|nr:hypothetical protein [Pseudomonas bohemica]